MRRTTMWGLVAGALLEFAAPVGAQVQAPNRAGVAMGHLHFHVPDVDAHRRFWLALGATEADPLGTARVVGFPGLLIVLSQAERARPATGSVVDHLALRVKAFAQLESRGVAVARRSIAGRQSATVTTPSGDQIELFEENAEQTRFVLDPGWLDPVANRHNQLLTDPVVPHHLHFNVPAGGDVAAQAWYVTTFGAVPGTRLRYKAADLPGMNLNFSAIAAGSLPTKGRTLDHVGFEVRDLQAFSKALEARGVKLDQPYTRRDDGVGVVLLTDPWGTSIELTEGLDHRR